MISLFISIRGLFPIDSIALSSGIMSYIEEVKLMDQNDFVILDHKSYLIDANLEDYFDNHLSL